MTEDVDFPKDFGKCEGPLVRRVKLSLTSISKYSFLQKDSPFSSFLAMLDSKKSKNWVAITMGDDLIPTIEPQGARWSWGT